MGLAQNWTSSVWQTSASANREDRILVQPKAGVDLAALADFHAAQKSEVLQTLECLGRLQVLRVPEGETVPGLIAKYQQSGLVEFAEPDYTIRVFAAPDDPKFLDGTLWGLNNTGQNGGTVDAEPQPLTTRRVCATIGGDRREYLFERAVSRLFWEPT